MSNLPEQGSGPLACEDLYERLMGIIRADDQLMQVLRIIRSLDLPDWRLFSGAVYQSVWNALTGRPGGYGVKDYDVGYFDPDTSWDAEDLYIKRAAAACAAPLNEQIELRNQARVHLWFKDRFGEDYAPLSCTDEAPSRFVAPAFAVGVRLEADDSLSVVAPFGLDDVFGMVIRPNPNQPRAGQWDQITAKLQGRWPELRIET